MVFPWYLSNNKSPQVSRTLYFSWSFGWFRFFLSCNFSNLFLKLLEIVPHTPTIISIADTSCYTDHAQDPHIYLVFPFLSFTLYATLERRNLQVDTFFSSAELTLDLVVWLWFVSFVLLISFPMWDSTLCIYNWSLLPNFNLLHNS